MSVIIPAFNEERYLRDTLGHLQKAEECLLAFSAGAAVQILVVDNASTDRTAEIARDAGLRVITEPDRNIARVRNTGAQAAAHDVLVFLDADTRVPVTLLRRISEAMADPDCLGGAVDAAYKPRRRLIQAYLRLWRVLGLLGGVAQGACQFCRRNIFVDLGGYDETLYMGEDVDFHFRLRRYARRREVYTSFIRDLQVVPSSRRFDQWPAARTLVWTNPAVVLALRRRKSAWAGWYREAPR